MDTGFGLQETQLPALELIENIPDVIELKNLSKNYGKVKALNGLDLTVKEGDVYGFLGRNGAGKSTAIRILMGITKPTKGTVNLFGKPLGKNHIELRQRVGYVAQEQNFYGWMTPETIGDFVSGFYPTWDDAEYVRLLKGLDLPKDRKIRTFSGGMRAKLALCLALAYRPSLLLLDEPTAGLDPIARREFIEMVRDQAENKTGTIFFSSHLIDEVEAAANCIGIIEKGKMYYQGALSELSNSVRLLKHPPVDSGDIVLPSFLLEGSYGIKIIQDRMLNGERHLVVRNSENPDIFSSMFYGEGNWSVEKMSLEDIFIELVRDPIRTL
ncbi:MAG: ABC transporter ATP-binding protein [Deltaproteobacteria bacterium]|nr:ABC transporter ATP-binding protein [Deltaproteobacteria bacterium]